MIVVVDASVVIKWLIQDPGREPDSAKAERLMEAIAAGEQPVLQPCHWITEVTAVLARVSAETAVDDAAMLCALELPVADQTAVLPRACNLLVELKQHVSDTYYHAVALDTSHALLVTADERYLRAARAKGRIIPLRDWQ